MSNFIKKIKQFFKNIISRNKKKRLEAPKDNNLKVSSSKLNSNQTNNNLNKPNDKKDFFEIYNKLKNRHYNLKELNEKELKKIIDILNFEISLKKDKLEHNITELNILKIDNRINEKNRIFKLYNEVQNENIDLNDINREDIKKIRKLLLEETKMQDEKFEYEIKLLEILKKVS